MSFSQKHLSPLLAETPPRLEAELGGEFELKEKEIEWLDKVGKALMASAARGARNNNNKVPQLCITHGVSSYFGWVTEFSSRGT